MTYRLSIFGFFILFASLLFAAAIPVRSISISGNDQTNDFIILREILVKVDSVYPENQIEALIKRSTDRLLNLNLFNQATINYALTESDQGRNYDVVVVVVEKWYTWPIPFVEFSDRNFNVWSNLNFEPGRSN